MSIFIRDGRHISLGDRNMRNKIELVLDKRNITSGERASHPLKILEGINFLAESINRGKSALPIQSLLS